MSGCEILKCTSLVNGVCVYPGECKYNDQLKKEALETILEMARNHPAFDEAAFDARDWESIMDQGGDIADWTIVAIIADDALAGRKTVGIP